MGELLVIVPTRGRPDNVRRVIEAWDATGAWADASLTFALDADDVEHPENVRRISHARALDHRKSLRDFTISAWQPMVTKLNAVATAGAGQYDALAFAGDDHLPRTRGWVRSYLDALDELGTGIVYGDDLVQGERLPTQWAMTADIVQALGRMVPADVEHLYCDNAILALGEASGCIRYLPDVIVEHAHPVAGRGTWDDQYRRVNRPDQYRRDGQAYRQWTRDGLERDAATARRLREEVANGAR